MYGRTVARYSSSKELNLISVAALSDIVDETLVRTLCDALSAFSAARSISSSIPLNVSSVSLLDLVVRSRSPRV